MTIELPIGKALAAVESKKHMDCENCYCYDLVGICRYFACDGRSDNKNVIFKLVGLPMEGEAK